MGTPQFAVPILEGLLANESLEVVAVVTQPDRKVGRKGKITPPPVKSLAQDQAIPVLQPERLKGSDQEKDLLKLAPDLIVTAAFGQYLPQEILDLPKFASINVHASLLPRYRGAAPIHYALWNGDQETGVTIMHMAQDIDAGNIISQAELAIGPDDDTGSLFEKLSYLGRDLLEDTLVKIFKGEGQGAKQDPSQVTYAPMISRDQEEISWQEPAQDLYNKIRAFRPFPGTYTWLGGNRFKIWDSHPVDQKTDKKPGQIVEASKKQLLVACGDQTILALDQVQPAGKSQMPIKSYLAGATLEEGMEFGQTDERRWPKTSGLPGFRKGRPRSRLCQPRSECETGDDECQPGR